MKAARLTDLRFQINFRVQPNPLITRTRFIYHPLLPMALFIFYP